MRNIVVFKPHDNIPIADLASIDIKNADVMVYDHNKRCISSSGANTSSWGLTHEEIIGTMPTDDVKFPLVIKNILEYLMGMALSGHTGVLFTIWMNNSYKLFSLPVYDSTKKKIIGGLNITYPSPIILNHTPQSLSVDVLERYLGEGGARENASTDTAENASVGAGENASVGEIEAEEQPGPTFAFEGNP